MAQMEKEMNYLRTELEAQKEANVRSPSNTMKNLVERLKAQLTQKEKQLKVVPFSSLELLWFLKSGTSSHFGDMRKCLLVTAAI